MVVIQNNSLPHFREEAGTKELQKYDFFCNPLYLFTLRTQCSIRRYYFLLGISQNKKYIANSRKYRIFRQLIHLKVLSVQDLYAIREIIAECVRRSTDTREKAAIYCVKQQYNMSKIFIYYSVLLRLG